MFHNRTRRFAGTGDGNASQPVPAGFVAIPIQHLPEAMQQMAGRCAELYRIAFEQARAAVEAAEIDTEWFTGEIG
jgi:hypothetical protein